MKKLEIELLRKVIAELEKGKQDYQTVFNQIGKKYRRLVRNAAQVTAAHYAPIREKMYLVFSRGVGKTTYAGDHMEAIVHNMPRSANNIIAPSYRKFNKEMLPSLIKSLEMLGYFKDVHYWVGVKPPKKYNIPTPYMQPTDYTNIITWYTGAIYQVISQDIQGSGRALSVDSEIRDEAAMLDKVKLEETSSATLRGSNVAKFEGNAYFGNSLTMSSMPLTSSGKWLLDARQLAIEYPKKYCHLMFNVGVNLTNLRKGYIADAKATALYEWIFRAEYLNEAPNTTLGAYYALLNEKTHTYTPSLTDYRTHDDCKYDYGDDNLRKNTPLIGAIDFGSRINVFIVLQLHDTKEGRVLRALKEFFAMGQDNKIQSDMVKEFLNYYSDFPNKRIALFFDRTGNNKTGITIETRIQLIGDLLMQNGWVVEYMSHGGANVAKSGNHLSWEHILKEEDKNLFKFRINKLNCKFLLVSMQSAPAKQTARGEVTKDKRSEGNNSIDPRTATDPSDAVDYVIDGLLGGTIQSGSGRIITNF